MEQLSPGTTTIESVLQSSEAATAEPMCHNYRCPSTWSPCSTMREATTMRSPHTATREQPRLAATREKPTSTEDPVQSKKKTCLASREQNKPEMSPVLGIPGGSDRKDQPAMQETPVQSLGWEGPLEKETATHSVFLPGEFHGQRSLACCNPWGCKESDTTEQLTHWSSVTQLRALLLPRMDRC